MSLVGDLWEYCDTIEGVLRDHKEVGESLHLYSNSKLKIMKFAIVAHDSGKMMSKTLTNSYVTTLVT